MGSVKLHMSMREREVVRRVDKSILSSAEYLSPHATAITPLITGCHSIQLMILSLLNLRSVNDWYSYNTIIEPYFTQLYAIP